MSEREWAEEQARDVIERWRKEQPNEHTDLHADCMVLHIERALRAAYQRGLEDAAQVCDQGDGAMSSIAETAIGNSLRDRIRALAGRGNGE